MWYLNLNEVGKKINNADTAWSTTSATVLPAEINLAVLLKQAKRAK